jgi:hypothetical protein
MENAWIVSWVSHQVMTHPSRLFDAGVYHPLPRGLTFSEHLIIPGLIALPLLRLTDDLVLTYNLILFFAMFSAALAMYLLTVSLTENRPAALLSGLFYSFAAYRLERLDLLQLQLYLFLPLMLACLHRFLRTGERRWVWGFGGFLVLQVLSGSYLAVMATASVAIALPTLLPGASCSRREIVDLVTVLVVSVLLVFPFTLPYLQTERSHRTEWDIESIEAVSANVDSYLASSSRLYRSLGRLWSNMDPADFLFPGATLLLLGALGTGILLTRRGGFPRPWSTVSCYGLILVVGVLLSLGPKTPMYVFLHEHIDLLRGLRNVTWFAFLMFFSLSVLSGFALTWMFRGSTFKARQNRFGAAIAVFFFIESARIPLEVAPLRDEPPSVYAWLADQPRSGTIVELPYRPRQTERLFYARHHGFRPSLGGVSQNAPASHQLLEVLLRRFPSPDSVCLLRRVDVRYIIIHLKSYPPSDLLGLLNRLARDRQALFPLSDFGDTLVYGLTPAQSPSPDRSGPTVAHKTLSCKILELDSRGRPPDTPEAEFEIRLDTKSQVSGLRLHYGPMPRIPTERVRLQVVDDETVSAPMSLTPPHWPALTELITGLLDNPQDATQFLRFHPIEAERFRIHLEGSSGAPVISGIEVLGSSNSN